MNRFDLEVCACAIPELEQGCHGTVTHFEAKTVFVYPKDALMDDQETIGGTEWDVAYALLQNLIELKEKYGRLWAIAATDCEKLVAWISYAVDATNSGVE